MECPFLLVLAALQLPNMLIRRQMEDPTLLMLDVPLFWATCGSVAAWPGRPAPRWPSNLAWPRSTAGSALEAASARKERTSRGVGSGIGIRLARFPLSGSVGGGGGGRPDMAQGKGQKGDQAEAGLDAFRAEAARQIEGT